MVIEPNRDNEDSNLGMRERMHINAVQVLAACEIIMTLHAPVGIPLGCDNFKHPLYVF